MKPTTEIYARFSSTGKPGLTKDVQGPVSEVLKALIPWVLGTYMGANMKITFARSEAELNQACGVKLSPEETAAAFMAQMEAELAESMKNGTYVE